MKLLMITRKVDKNDWLAGFAWNWVKKIGEQVDQLHVICLEKGDITGLPENIKVHSLRERNSHHSYVIRKLVSFYNFQKLAWQLVPQVDGIFCHMNPEYTIAIWPYAKIFNKPIASWYLHRAINWKTKLMEKLTNKVLTASALSFRLSSAKVKILGHGIDINLFKPAINPEPHKIFKIITVGRISPTKDYESLIKAVDLLVKSGVTDLVAEIIGEAGLVSQQAYFDDLRLMVSKMNLERVVKFVGAIPNYELPKYYQQADLFINLSGTGSLDKAVLEAMACGCLVLTSNEAFKEVLPTELMVIKNNPAKLAEKIKWLRQLPLVTKLELQKTLRSAVEQNHNLDKLVLKIIEQFKT